MREPNQRVKASKASYIGEHVGLIMGAISLATFYSSLWPTAATYPLTRLTLEPYLYPYDNPYSMFILSAKDNSCLYALGGFFSEDKFPPECTSSLNPISNYLFVNTDAFTNISTHNHRAFNESSMALIHESKLKCDVTYHLTNQPSYLQLDLPWKIVQFERIHKEFMVLLQYCAPYITAPSEPLKCIEDRFKSITIQARKRWDKVTSDYNAQQADTTLYLILNYFPIDLVVSLLWLKVFTTYIRHHQLAFFQSIDILLGDFPSDFVRQPPVQNNPGMMFFNRRRPRDSSSAKKAYDDAIDSIFISSRYARLNAISFDVTDIPNEYLCPISNTIMEHPILMEDGHHYEEKSVIALFGSSKSILSPMTRKRMQPKGTMDLKLNRVIEDFVREQEDSCAQNNDRMCTPSK